MSESMGSYNQSEDIFNEDSFQTLKREIRNIGVKMKYSVLMIPGDREEAIKKLQEWDLWGPFLICLVFSLGIGLHANEKYAYDDFVNVFAIFWLGSFVCSVNCRMLGNKGSILQGIGIIGYCMIPIAIIGLLIAILPNSTPVWIRLPLILFSLLWSTVSCMLVMGNIISQTKKYLCGYPIFLFYIFLAWYAIIS